MWEGVISRSAFLGEHIICVTGDIALVCAVFTTVHDAVQLHTVLVIL